MRDHRVSEWSDPPCIVTCSPTAHVFHLLPKIPHSFSPLSPNILFFSHHADLISRRTDCNHAGCYVYVTWATTCSETEPLKNYSLFCNLAVMHHTVILMCNCVAWWYQLVKTLSAWPASPPGMCNLTCKLYCSTDRTNPASGKNWKGSVQMTAAYAPEMPVFSCRARLWQKHALAQLRQQCVMPNLW